MKNIFYLFNLTTLRNFLSQLNVIHKKTICVYNFCFILFCLDRLFIVLFLPFLGNISSPIHIPSVVVVVVFPSNCPKQFQLSRKRLPMIVSATCNSLDCYFTPGKPPQGLSPLNSLCLSYQLTIFFFFF